MKHLARFCLSVCLLLALWPPSFVFANPSPLRLTDELMAGEEPLPLLDHAGILQDPSGKLTLRDVLADGTGFQPVQGSDGKLDVSLTHSAYWLRVELLNLSAQKDWYLSLSGSLSRKVEVYLATNAAGQPFIQQPLLPHAHANQYRLSLPVSTSLWLYLRIQDRQNPLVIDPVLYSPSQMLAETMVTYPLYSFAVGGLLTLAIYNLLYFFYLRDRSFLALSAFILGFVLEMGNHSGLWHYFGFLRQHLGEVGNTFGFMAIAASISLVASWLELRQYLPGFYRLFQLAFWISLLLIPLHWWVGYGAAFAGGLALLLLVPYVAATVIRYRQGFHFSFMLRAGILLVLFGFIPTLLRGVGLIGNVPLLTDSMYFVLLLALVMLSLTQAEQVRMKSERAERIAAANQAKDEFLTTMSHELRTPMNAVVNAGRLLQLTSLSATQNEYVTRMGISARHMLALIDDILDLARLDSSLLRMEELPFSLAEVLRQTEQLLVEQARGKHLQLSITNRFHPLKKQLAGDPTRLRQVLLNLLNNAIKFTPQGSVSLTVTPQEVSSDNARLLFEVRDTGIGISDADRQKLFQPFSQLDSSTARQYGGSGLGLAISYKLVRRMGGELQVQSLPGRGSRFFFTLVFPLRESQPKTQMDMPAVAPASLPGELRILLVDDDEMNRFLGGELIRSLGVVVEVADSGETALQLLRQQNFDLVFMDVGMPGMDGYETTRRLRADPCCKGVSVIALTAHAIAGERERCLAAGMDDYLTKPFDIDQLELAIWRWSKQSSAG